MTLDTRVVAYGAAVNVHEVYELCRAMIGTPDSVEPYDGGNVFSYAKKDGRRLLMHRPGAGCDAWLMITYGTDGPMPPPEPDIEDENGVLHHPFYVSPVEVRGEASIIISFDSGSGYRGPNGEHVGDLHAKYVFVLGTYLNRKELRWSWLHESNGEWHNEFDELGSLGNPHCVSDSMDWFIDEVAPAINRRKFVGKTVDKAFSG